MSTHIRAGKLSDGIPQDVLKYIRMLSAGPFLLHPQRSIPDAHGMLGNLKIVASPRLMAMRLFCFPANTVQN